MGEVAQYRARREVDDRRWRVRRSRARQKQTISGIAPQVVIEQLVVAQHQVERTIYVCRGRTRPMGRARSTDRPL